MKYKIFTCWHGKHRPLSGFVKDIEALFSDYLNRVVPEKIDVEMWQMPEIDEMKKRQNFGNRQRANGWNDCIDEIHKRMEGEL